MNESLICSEQGCFADTVDYHKLNATVTGCLDGDTVVTLSDCATLCVDHVEEKLESELRELEREEGVKIEIHDTNAKLDK
jgi:hypothetical protein